MSELRRELEREWYTLAVLIDRLTAIGFILYFVGNALVSEWADGGQEWAVEGTNY